MTTIKEAIMLYSQFTLTVIQQKNEQEIPDERTHERRFMYTIILIETNNVEELE